MAKAKQTNVAAKLKDFGDNDLIEGWFNPTIQRELREKREIQLLLKVAKQIRIKLVSVV